MTQLFNEEVYEELASNPESDIAQKLVSYPPVIGRFYIGGKLITGKPEEEENESV